MANSQSGYPMLTEYGDPRLMPNPLVPGSTARIYGGLLAGDPATVLLYFYSRFNAEVEELGAGPIDDWGFDPQHNATTSTSDHKSGTAGDLNSTRHPQHVRGTFTPAQYATMRRIAGDLERSAGGAVVRMGIDWSDRSVDEMHVSLAKAVAGTGRVERAAAAIRAGLVPNVHRDQLSTPPPATTPPATTPPPKDDDEMTPEQHKAICDRLDAGNAILTSILANVRDTRAFAGQTRDNTARIASGESVVKVGGTVTTR